MGTIDGSTATAPVMGQSNRTRGCRMIQRPVKWLRKSNDPYLQHTSISHIQRNIKWCVNREIVHGASEWLLTNEFYFDTLSALGGTATCF